MQLQDRSGTSPHILVFKKRLGKVGGAEPNCQKSRLCDPSHPSSGHFVGSITRSYMALVDDPGRPDFFLLGVEHSVNYEEVYLLTPRNTGQFTSGQLPSASEVLLLRQVGAKKEASAFSLALKFPPEVRERKCCRTQGCFSQLICYHNFGKIMMNWSQS